jgi:hypothetical protein
VLLLLLTVVALWLWQTCWKVVQWWLHLLLQQSRLEGHLHRCVWSLLSTVHVYWFCHQQIR